MEKAWMEDKEAWLFDLAHGDLDQDAIVKGFLKHYVLQEQGIADVQQNLHFHTLWGLLHGIRDVRPAQGAGGPGGSASQVRDADTG